MGFSGGDTDALASGGDTLTTAGRDVASTREGIAACGRAGGAGAGGSPVGAAMQRFAAAYGVYLDDTGTQVQALGTLARATGEDIAAATGGGA